MGVGYLIAGVLFCLAALGQVLVGNTAIGMMLLSVGLMFTTLGLGFRRSSASRQGGIKKYNENQEDD